MKYDWKKGMSLSFFQDEQGGSIGADTEILRKVSEHGFDCVELSFSHDDYFYKYKFTEERMQRSSTNTVNLLGWRSGAFICHFLTTGICQMMMQKRRWRMIKS